MIIFSLLENRPVNVKEHIINFLSDETNLIEEFPPLVLDSNKNHEKNTKFEKSEKSEISPEILYKTRKDSRRKAMSSSFKDSDRIKNKVITKDKETILSLVNNTKKVPLLSFLQDDQRELLVSSMGLKQFSNNEVICQEGSRPDNFYIISKGQCKVMKRRNDKDFQIGLKKCNECFGELTLISESVSSASFVADGPVTCWAINQDEYLSILKAYREEKRKRLRNVLKKIPLFSLLKEHELLLVIDAVQVWEPGSDEVIVKEGDDADEFFVIFEGECKVSKKDKISGSKELGVLREGSYFGELALMKNIPRSITVKSGKGCKLGKLDRKSFCRLLDYKSCNDMLTNPKTNLHKNYRE
ncbi:cAMP-dependent protein kinase regulatory subunit [Histomonas meleagridis]|uniref:cAMP-dependent protein kinase regulatory subunit n=1 Tax=Histomonas meleagridis TaxID=135588 RepID=UPI00355A4E59|nr:cAMP-dependent protein kinase regulatory subunit [Histomonas meleagridis]KAH0806295.1 cAMP-dependent protein kinase regulatory subunit [Histomonas meleagridis]